MRTCFNGQQRTRKRSSRDVPELPLAALKNLALLVPPLEEDFCMVWPRGEVSLSCCRMALLEIVCTGLGASLAMTMQSTDQLPSQLAHNRSLEKWIKIVSRRTLHMAFSLHNSTNCGLLSRPIHRRIQTREREASTTPAASPATRMWS